MKKHSLTKYLATAFLYFAHTIVLGSTSPQPRVDVVFTIQNDTKDQEFFVRCEIGTALIFFKEVGVKPQDNKRLGIAPFNHVQAGICRHALRGHCAFRTGEANSKVFLKPFNLPCNKLAKALSKKDYAEIHAKVTINPHKNIIYSNSIENISDI